jgi:hypothetical protein
MNRFEAEVRARGMTAWAPSALNEAEGAGEGRIEGPAGADGINVPKGRRMSRSSRCDFHWQEFK